MILLKDKKILTENKKKKIVLIHYKESNHSNLTIMSCLIKEAKNHSVKVQGNLTHQKSLANQLKLINL